MSKQRGLLEMALDAWYQWEQPYSPRARCEKVAAYYGVSEPLLWKYTQLDFGRRVESY